MGGCGREWRKRSLGVGVHAGFFLLSTFDEAALVLEPVCDAGGSGGQGAVRRGGMGEDRPLISPGFQKETRGTDRSQSVG
jgi:hypothetical protein